MFSKKKSEKCCVPAHGCKANPTKQRHLIIAIIAIFCSIISCVSLAILIRKTNSITNEFENSYVACQVLENGTNGNSEFDGQTKTNVRIKNTGEVQSYIRAAVVVTWMSEDQSKVTAKKPLMGTDYDITYVSNSNWEMGLDGYWYYTVPVDVGSETTTLIESCVCNVTPPDGYYLSVEIVASSIQSSPVNVVKEQWDSGVSDVNGTTLVIK